jgi:perosamine synthetase
MARRMIQLFKPFFGQEELEALREPFETGWIGLGPKTAEFERKFAEFIGVKYAVGVNSCTAALDLALKLLDIRNGDEVIVPTMTFVSTAHVVAYNLATPIFADVDEKTLDIDLEDVKRKITRRTKAIIPVHYGGRPCNMDALKEMAGGKMVIIEDAAHACGAEYMGKKCGSLGDIGCFSFHAVKNLAMGDGGALTLNDKEMYERAKRMRWLGIDKGTWDRTKADKSYWWEYLVDEIGLKCHMNDIQAAIGLVQLKKLASMNKRRREIVKMYNEGFKNIDWIETPPEDTDEYKSSWHIYCVKVNVIDRNDLSAYLERNGIGTGVHYKPIHTYLCYGNRPSLPIAERVFKRILSLPMHPGLSDDDVKRIIGTIKRFQ